MSKGHKAVGPAAKIILLIINFNLSMGNIFTQTMRLLERLSY